MAVNFVPRNGARIKYVVPGPGSGFPADTDTFLNVNAGDPFGGQVLDTGVYRARYGTPPVNAAGTEGVFQVYAEAIGTLSTAMANAAKDANNPWGLHASGNGAATTLEVYDFAATECPQGRNSAIFRYLGDGQGSGGEGASSPGQPAITSLSSPEPGIVKVEWKTRTGHTGFKVEAFHADSLSGDPAIALRLVDGESRQALLFTPSGLSGTVAVTVTAYIGGVAGKPSLSKTVTVIAASGDTTPHDPPPPPPPPPVVEPPKPPVTPPPVAPPPTKLSAALQQTVHNMQNVEWTAHVGWPKRAQLKALAEELKARGLVE